MLLQCWHFLMLLMTCCSIHTSYSLEKKRHRNSFITSWIFETKVKSCFYVLKKFYRSLDELGNFRASSIYVTQTGFQIIASAPPNHSQFNTSNKSNDENRTFCSRIFGVCPGTGGTYWQHEGWIRFQWGQWRSNWGLYYLSWWQGK